MIAMPSTAIAQFNYDRESAVLTVTFITGRRYEYYAVPDEVFAAFKNAFSKGTFFNANIREHYRFHEITAGRRLSSHPAGAAKIAALRRTSSRH
jgi:copper oxidase (laccase) domain-containing protein